MVSAHCDLPCGVYDPAQARIEAESVKAICEKYQANRTLSSAPVPSIIKEQRAELVKHHLWVLWTDYFKPPHFEKYPQLHSLFNEATKLAGASGAKGSADPATAEQLLGRSTRSRRSSGRPSRREQSRSVVVRPVRPADVPAVVAMVHELAAYETRARRVPLTEDQLTAALFGPIAAPCSAHVALDVGPRRARRFRAVVPQLLHLARRARHLPGGPLRPARPPAAAVPAGPCSPTLAAICVERGYRRLEWWVLHWNPAREFYDALGATAMDEWVPYRLTGAALEALLTRGHRASSVEMQLRCN